MLDMVALGAPIVDVVMRADDAFLVRHHLFKGERRAVDSDEAGTLYRALPSLFQGGGGSAANVACGVAALGGLAGFVGCVGSDELGELFRRELSDAAVQDGCVAVQKGETACCLIFVTPDAERTMATYMGCSGELGVDMITPQLWNSQWFFLEGYLLLDAASRRMAEAMVAQLRLRGVRVALSLGDPACARESRSVLQSLLPQLDMVFANADEAMALANSNNLDDAVTFLASHCRQAVVTRGAAGSVIITPQQQWQIDAAPVVALKDTTGAGDIYAAGFLYGLSRGWTLPSCGALASLAAAEIIQQHGGRPTGDWRHLPAQIQQRGAA